MWPELIEDIRLELKLLHELLDGCRPVMEAAAGERANSTDKLAAATLLQCFWNGAERVLRHLAEQPQEAPPSGEPSQPGSLLDLVAAPTGSRPAIISPELAAGLRQYAGFWNSFRDGHLHRLDWGSMAAMVRQCPDTLARLEAELDQFIRQHAKARLLAGAEAVELPPYWFAAPAGRPVSPAGARRAVVLAAMAGVAAGVALSAGYRAIPRRAGVGHEPQAVPAANMRQLAAQVADQLRAWQAEPEVRHALGVLAFLDRPDWHFAFAGDQAVLSGDVRGRSESIGGSAVLAFEGGRLLRIELEAAADRYVFSFTDTGLARAAHYHKDRGTPRSVVELSRGGRVVYIGNWSYEAGGIGPADGHGQASAARRRDRFFHADGRAMLDAISGPAGPIRTVILRTGPDSTPAAGYAADAGGVLRPLPPDAARLQDLPGGTASRPASSPG